MNTLRWLLFVQKKNTTQEIQKGRRANKSFAFSKCHPLYSTHEQYLKSKQPVVIFSGKAPCYPGMPPPQYDDEGKISPEYKTWTKKANMFSIYYLAAFRPECELYSAKSEHHLGTSIEVQDRAVNTVLVRMI